MKKYNQLLIKDNNKKQIYQLIEDFPGISRTQIAEQLKLSKTTVSALVDEMMQEMFVIDEGASESSRQGRKPNSLAVNNSTNYVIVLNWHKDNLEIALVDSAMNIVLCREYDMKNAGDALAGLKGYFEEFREAQCVDIHVMGVCVIVPGMIDEKHDEIISVVLPTESQGNYKISRLRSMLDGYPLAILNDTACFAYAPQDQIPQTAWEAPTPQSGSPDIPYCRRRTGIRCGPQKNGQTVLPCRWPRREDVCHV